VAPKEIPTVGKLVRVFLYVKLFRNVFSIVNPFVTVYWLFVVFSKNPVVRPIPILTVGA
jgi:hypothetical protein